MGPVPAVKAALAKAGLTVEDIDAIECNEAFASQACAVARPLACDPAKIKPERRCDRARHPIGATGAVLAVKAIHELTRADKRCALNTLCIGGGQGIAAVIERQ